jgi:hypothetical protein
VGLDVRRHGVELFLQFHERHVVELSGMDCLTAKGCKRGLPSRLLDGHREGEPAVD